MNKSDIYFQAITLEVQGQFNKAALKYEIVVQSNQGPLDAYINLSSIYWHFSDPNMIDYYKFNASSEFDQNQDAELRSNRILNLAKAKFSEHPEVVFWLMYYPDVYLGTPTNLSFDNVLRLVRESSIETLVPYFFLFNNAHKRERNLYRPYAERLREHARSMHTIKNLYILDILHQMDAK